MAKAKYFLTYSLNNGSEIVKEPIVFSSKSAAKAAGESALAAHDSKARNTSVFSVSNESGAVVVIGICDAFRPLFYPVK